MYLKRIEIHGFKSFADRVNVTFQPGITGIVGPNGCGKSNISDAVRWVLGEQSVKSLRGSHMSDVIFAGSQDRQAQNLAEVTLVFDNTDRMMNYDYNEVEITRRLYRQGNEAEYLLNRQPCRLKDITELIMDTGLGRDSLSIISQGNISHFADNKPDERRVIFEEAAGVSKYKKRKIESIRRLERTEDNLNRIGDIVFELEKQLAPLKKQKEKAEKYLDIKEKLKSVEVNVLVREISETKRVLDEVNAILKKENERLVSIDAEILLKEGQNDTLKKKMYALDNEVNNLQANLLEAMNEVSRLEANKIEIDQKRKHLLETTDVHDIKQRLAHLKEILRDIVDEYNDRVDRLKETKQELVSLQKEQENIQNEMTAVQGDITFLTSELARSKNRKDVLIDAFENKSNYVHGVKAILSYAKSHYGIIGVLGDLLQCDEQYETALATALGGAQQFVVTKDDYEARQAIKFLKDNRAGRATFLPLSVMEPRRVREEHLLLLQDASGYLGVLSDFVTSEKKIKNIILNQLGNVLLCDNIDNASKISKTTFARYKVVTLDGNVINVGGSLTGGSATKNQSSMNQKRELEKVDTLIAHFENKQAACKVQLGKLDNRLKEVSHALLQKQMSYAKLEVVVQGKREKLMKAKAEYEALGHQSVELNTLASGQKENQLVVQLNQAMRYKDELTENIKSKRETRMAYMNESEALEIDLRSLRHEQKSLSQSVNQNSIQVTKYEGQMQSFLTRLNDEYQMTYEYASSEYHDDIDLEDAKYKVAAYRNEIVALGHVNVGAIEEYEEVSSRYETLNSQRNDLIEAQNAIVKAIEEMDEIMIEKFSSTFEKINVEFNNVFRSLFGGGRAEIRYSDPTNILETGIDIDVQPPGKAVQNITLFSGGEKALIAISCLFAILKVRPVPMCILDEVEAALDMANVERFAKFLKEFSQQTQFIVVTHREGTMEECDLLYGATMQQKGVTKLVSVKLEEAIDLSQEGS